MRACYQLRVTAGNIIDVATFQAITSAYRAGRISRRARTARTPFLVRAARLAARVAPTWKQVRTTVLTVTAFGCLTAAAWMVALPLGLLAAGLSLLFIELLTSDR